MSKTARTTKQQLPAADRDLSKIPAARLQAELARRQRRVRPLMRRHGRLLESAKAISAEIAALGGPVGRGLPGTAAARGRRNDVNLVQALKRAMGDKPMRVSEAADAALKAGYITASPSFRQIVNITLIRSGDFARVGRGRYRVK